MFGRLLLILFAVASCEREHKAEPGPPAEPCFADEIGKLRGNWKELEGCTPDNESCRKACEGGDGDSCFNLAIAMQAQSIAANKLEPEIVSERFKRACKLGVALGCTNWGAHELFAVKTSKVTSRCLYRVFDKACDAGEPFACSMTARILIEWPKTVADTWIGYNQLTNACERFDGPPCRFLAYYIERGDFGAPDPVRVKQLLRRACDGDDEDACGKDKAIDSMQALPSSE